MKFIFKAFFKTVRFVLGPILLLWERSFPPKGIVRTPEAQKSVDQKCQALALYQFKTCPFCMKVRRAMRRKSLNIELRDAQHNAQHRADLLQGGGQIKVPCLRITDAQGNSAWIYESKAIVQYLQQQFD
jgi:glutaredoxin